MTYVIGLTGGIGSGKSTVSKILEELGAVVIDADKLGHEVYLPETETWHRLVEKFGSRILLPDNNIDRKKLGEIVFDDPVKLKELNSIVHSTMDRIVESRIEDYRRKGIAVVVLDAALLIEGGWISLADQVWVVVSEEENVVKRVIARTGMTEEQVRLRIKSQMSNEERIGRAQAVIRNNGTLAELKERVKQLWSDLRH